MSKGKLNVLHKQNATMKALGRGARGGNNAKLLGDSRAPRIGDNELIVYYCLS